MRIRNRLVVVGMMAVMAMAAACGGSTVVGVEQTGGGDPGEPATELIRFDADSFPLDESVAAVDGMCVPSQAVPGSYRCRTEADGQTVDPCFGLSSGDLVCEPNPVDGSYTLQLRPTGPLPALSRVPEDAEPFFLELDGDAGPCVAHTGIEPVLLAGIPARYDCAEAYTYVLGFEKSTPVWDAAVVVLDPATGDSTVGGIPTAVLRAWRP